MFVPALLWLWVALASAQANDLPSELVLHFDPSAARLDQTQIRAALERELGVPLADAGSAGAPTLSIRLTDGGDLELTYDPERRRITRSAPLTQSTVVPELVAHLAGNMVRDEASMLIRDLRPEASPPSAPAAPPRLPAPPTPIGEKPATNNPASPRHVASSKTRPWLLSFLLGGTVNPVALGVLTVQASRRFERLELGVGVEGAYGYGDVIVQNTRPDRTVDVGAASLVPRQIMGVTLPVSLDLTALRRAQWYLQLGALGGFRMMGIVHQSLGRAHLSGSHDNLFVALRLTAGLELSEGRSLLLRGTWDVAPRLYRVPADYEDYVIAVFTTLQLGYAMSF